MAKTLVTMQNYVGNMVNDTSSNFYNLIKIWINDAHRDAGRRFFWSSLIDYDYSFVTVASTATYNQPTRFDRELFCVNITSGEELERFNIRNWWKERGKDYSSGSLEEGTPAKYLITDEDSKVKLDPVPDAVYTIAFPYQKTVVDFSITTDMASIANIDTYLERYAISMGHAYYKKYDKADWWMQKAELELAKLVSHEQNKINQMFKRYPEARDRAIHRLTGNRSYNSL